MPRDPAEFSDRGFSPEEAEDWARAFFWAEGATAWRDAGFEPEEAHVWAEAGLEPTEAAQWRALLTPSDSRPPKHHDDDHAEWHTWREVSAASTWWRHLGFSLAETKRWLEAGFEPQDARPAAGYRDEGFRPDEARAASLTSYRCRAHIEMLTTDAGGLKRPLWSPTRHLVLKFETGASEALDIGATIATDQRAPLEPGGDYAVQLMFWAPEAEAILAGRDKFDLWARRIVGTGFLTPGPG